MAHMPGILDADRARADQLQGTLTFHRLQVGALDCGSGGARLRSCGRCAAQMPFDLFRTGQRYQFALAVEQLLDPAPWPNVRSLEREVAAEVEQGVLATLSPLRSLRTSAVRVIDVAAFGRVSWRAG